MPCVSDGVGVNNDDERCEQWHPDVLQEASEEDFHGAFDWWSLPPVFILLGVGVVAHATPFRP